MIEFTRWYSPGAALYRCGGCGAHVSESDIPLHQTWHEMIESALRTLDRTVSTVLGD